MFEVNKGGTTHFERKEVPFSDLRLIDSNNNNHNPTILIRKNVTLLRTGFISCIIRFNELWVFDPTSPVVANAIHSIENSLRKGNYSIVKKDAERPDTVQEEVSFHKTTSHKTEETDYHEKDHVNDSERETVEDTDIEVTTDEKESIRHLEKHLEKTKLENLHRCSISDNFEFLCFDICMQLSLKAYGNEINKINETIKKKMQLQRKEEESNEINILTNKTLIDMMKVKNNLQKLSNLVDALRTSIERILKDDNDMKDMYLTFLNTYGNQITDHSELEILLETHLQLTEELYQHLRNVEEQITHYEELMRLNLDYNRNKLILLNVKISFFTLTCSLCSILTGLFGMNLKNFVEMNDYVFFIVTIFVSLSSIMGLLFSKNVTALLKFFDKTKSK